MRNVEGIKGKTKPICRIHVGSSLGSALIEHRFVYVCLCMMIFSFFCKINRTLCHMNIALAYYEQYYTFSKAVMCQQSLVGNPLYVLVYKLLLPFVRLFVPLVVVGGITAT